MQIVQDRSIAHNKSNWDIVLQPTFRTSERRPSTPGTHDSAFRIVSNPSRFTPAFYQNPSSLPAVCKTLLSLEPGPKETRTRQPPLSQRVTRIRKESIVTKRVPSGELKIGLRNSAPYRLTHDAERDPGVSRFLPGFSRVGPRPRPRVLDPTLAAVFTHRPLFHSSPRLSRSLFY